MTELDEIIQNPISRRTFMVRMTAAGLGAAAVALLAGCGGGGTSHPDLRNGGGTTTAFADQANFPGIAGANENTVVLNYALTLETLEADLYRQALNLAAGKAVGTALPSDTSSYTLAVGTGGLSSDAAAVGFLYLKQYAAVEAAHRDFLRTALGSAAVGANANGYTTGLSAGSDLKTILTLIRTVEETGVTAYLGAAGFLTDPTLVQIASTIYTTEARHSAAINYVLGLDTGPAGAAGGAQPVSGSTNEFEYANTPKTVLAAVKPFFV